MWGKLQYQLCSWKALGRRVLFCISLLSIFSVLLAIWGCSHHHFQTLQPVFSHSAWCGTSVVSLWGWATSGQAMAWPNQTAWTPLRFLFAQIWVTFLMLSHYGCKGSCEEMHSKSRKILARKKAIFITPRPTLSLLCFPFKMSPPDIFPMLFWR